MRGLLAHLVTGPWRGPASGARRETAQAPAEAPPSAPDPGANRPQTLQPQRADPPPGVSRSPRPCPRGPRNQAAQAGVTTVTGPETAERTGQNPHSCGTHSLSGGGTPARESQEGRLEGGLGGPDPEPLCHAGLGMPSPSLQDPCCGSSRLLQGSAPGLQKWGAAGESRGLTEADSALLPLLSAP